MTKKQKAQENSADFWSQYKEFATKLRNLYGYGKDKKGMGSEDEKDGENGQDLDGDKPIDVKDEIEQKLSNFNFLNENSKKALQHFNKAFANRNKKLIMLLNKILDDRNNNKITDLRQIPFINGQSEEQDIIMLVMLIQNCL